MTMEIKLECLRIAAECKSGDALARAREFYAWVGEGAAKDEAMSAAEVRAAIGLPTDAQPDAFGWISWAGGGCPLRENRLVDLIFRNGEIVSAKRAYQLLWEHFDTDGDIVAYRISKGAA